MRKMTPKEFYEIRWVHNWTQKDTAVNLSYMTREPVTQQMVSRWERGEEHICRHIAKAMRWVQKNSPRAAARQIPRSRHLHDDSMFDYNSWRSSTKGR